MVYLKSLLKKYPYLTYSVWAVFLNLLIIGLVVFVQRFLPPEVPLFYGLPESSAQLTSSIFLMIPNLLALALVVINSSLSIILKNDFMSRILTISGFVVSLFCAITTLRIIFLVSGF